MIGFIHEVRGRSRVEEEEEEEKPGDEFGRAKLEFRGGKTEIENAKTKSANEVDMRISRQNIEGKK